jgi:hypothetical protein
VLSCLFADEIGSDAQEFAHAALQNPWALVRDLSRDTSPWARCGRSSWRPEPRAQREERGCCEEVFRRYALGLGKGPGGRVT